MDKWKGKYRIPSARAEWWDYANDGAYFITICTQNRAHFLGKCLDSKMQLTTVGAIVQGFWYEIPKHFPFVTLGEFIVMPNHIHGVLILERGDDVNRDVVHDANGDADRDADRDVEIGHCPISTPAPYDMPAPHDTPNDNLSPAQKRFQNQGKKTVSSIVGSYKSICSKHIHLAFPALNFGWQKLFWDNIIKDETAFDNITNYIINNPKKWENDKFYPNEE